MTPPPGAYDATLRATQILVALWCALSSSEAIVASAARPRDDETARAIALLRRERSRRWLRSSAIGSRAGSRAAAVVCGIAGLALAVARDPALVVALFATLIVGTALMRLVGEQADGADKIAVVACMAGAMIAGGRALGDRWLCLAGVAWAAGQLVIAYATSGAAKLSRGFWRDGSGVAAAMTSFRSGHALAAAFVRNPSRAAILAWMVMLPEALFPFAMLAPLPVFIVMLGYFAAFHFATAVVMGLNTYPWAFIATYPCALMAHQIIAQALGLAS